MIFYLTIRTVSLKTHSNYDLIDFEINLEKSEPIFYRPYRYSENEKAVIRTKVQDLLDINKIRPSNSSLACPAVIS